MINALCLQHEDAPVAAGKGRVSRMQAIREL